MTRRLALVGGLAVAVAAAWSAWPPSTAAHGLSARRDLPVPEWLFAWVASFVLVMSFVALSTLWQTPRLERLRERSLVRLPFWLDVACGAIGVALFALVVYAGFAGTEQPNRNLAPTFIFVLFWVGLAVVCAALGDVFKPFNPWRAVGRLIAATMPGTRQPRPYPVRLGRWPAAAALAAFGWLELVYSGNDNPTTLAWLALAYAAVQLVGMARYGVDPWCERADGFGVYFSLFARVAPLAIRERRLVARWPFTGLVRLDVLPGTLAVLFVMIGTTAFDGATNSDLWGSLGPSLASTFQDLGASPTTADALAGTIGLAGSILLITGIYRIGVMGMQRISSDARDRSLGDRFAHTLVPIALAYVIAHYFSLVAFQGQATAYLISDPLGNGTDLLGTADATIDYAAVSAATIWYVQVAALVVGHAVALALAHDRALTVFPRARDAARSQYWMLAVMVGYTSLGLWLLSAVAS